MTWVVAGASSGLGRAVAEALAAPGRSLLLSSRDGRDLAALAAHLALTRGATVATVAADARDPDAFSRALAAAAPEGERVEGVLLPLGAMDEEDGALLAPERAASIVAVNYLAVAAVAARFLPDLAREPGGVLVGFGSVAGTRGRRRNLHYAASKRALRVLFEGIAHGFSERGVRVQLWVLGYHDTALAWGLDLPFPKADPAATARRVVARLGKGSGTFYAPRPWRLLTALLRCLPGPLWRRVKA